MPCRTDPPDYYYQDKKKIEDLKVLLCSACSSLETYSHNFALNPSLDEWWHEHKEEDARRKAKEAQKNLELTRCRYLMSNVLLSNMKKEDRELLRKHKFI